MPPKGKACQNGDLAASVGAVHIVRGIFCFGVAQVLGDFKGLVKAHVLAGHFGEHKVGGSVHNALDLADLVCRKALVQRGDHRGAAPHARLKQKGRAVLLCQGQQLRAIGGHHLFVAGHHAAPALQRPAHIRVSKAGAADGLHHHPYFRIGQDHIHVVHEQRRIGVRGKIAHLQNIFYLHRLPGPARNARRVAAQHLQNAAAHRAEAQNCDLCHFAMAPFLLCSARARLHARPGGPGPIRPAAPPPPCAGGAVFPAFPPPSAAWCRCAHSRPPGPRRFPGWPG